MALAVLASMTAGCGGSPATDAGPVPERPAATVDVAAPGMSPSAEDGTVDPPGAGATTPPPAATGPTTEVSLWFARGEALEPVTRAVPRVPRIGAEAVKALLAGPTPAESRAGLTTAVPRQTRFLDMAIDGSGIATVDLSRDFETGGGSLGLTLRLAQVTCTAAQFPTVKGVRFALAGQLVSVFSGNGIVLDAPVTCDSYREVLRPAVGTVAFAGIWPFTTTAELEAYAAGPDRAWRDPVATARGFATSYLGMDDPVDFAFKSTGPGAGEVPIGFRFGEGRTPVASPRATLSVILRQLGAQGPSGPWTVVGATSPDIMVTTPSPLDKVGSPVRLTGQARTFEGTVDVQIREDGMLAGESLGRGFVTGSGGGSLGPYAGAIGFRSPTKPGGAIVLTEISAADGQGILRAAVVRVRF